VVTAGQRGLGDAVAAGLATLAECASGADVRAAEVCHEVAVLLDRLGDRTAAEALHRRAGTLLVDVPTGNDVDRQRIAWARSLAGNLTAQGRDDEALDVLRAAIALSEALLGSDDIETAATVVALDEVASRSSGAS